MKLSPKKCSFAVYHYFADEGREFMLYLALHQDQVYQALYQVIPVHSFIPGCTSN